MSDQRPHQLIRQARGVVARATGHRYMRLEQACESMDAETLQELIRLIRNMDSKVTTERNKRRRGQFW